MIIDLLINSIYVSVLCRKCLLSYLGVWFYWWSRTHNDVSCWNEELCRCW